MRPVFVPAGRARPSRRDAVRVCAISAEGEGVKNPSLSGRGRGGVRNISYFSVFRVFSGSDFTAGGRKRHLRRENRLEFGGTGEGEMFRLLRDVIRFPFRGLVQ